MNQKEISPFRIALEDFWGEFSYRYEKYETVVLKYEFWLEKVLWWGTMDKNEICNKDQFNQMVMQKIKTILEYDHSQNFEVTKGYYEKNMTFDGIEEYLKSVSENSEIELNSEKIDGLEIIEVIDSIYS